MPIRVLVVDDHALVRRGLVELLASADDVAVVGAAGDGEGALALAAEHAPDVILMDLSMPTMDGIEATRRVLTIQPSARVVVLTSFGERDLIFRALDAGAVGFLLKDVEPDELLRGIRAAAAGESPLAAKAAREVLAERAARAPARPADGLTSREREVLSLVGVGLANKAIARRLGISEKTVKAHLTRVFSSIGVTDRTQAALWARSRGIAPEAPGS